MKRKRKQTNKSVVSRNALSSQEPKKRFGKKQKKKLIIICTICLIVFIGLSYLAKSYQIKQAEAEERAKKGKLIEKEAEKTELDDEGNEIITHHDTEIHILDVGDGNATLIKKGHYEVLVDAGSSEITDYLSPHIDGDLEYFITTNRFDANMRGADVVRESFAVDNYIYNNIKSDKGEAANGQSIDMGENLIVTVSPGLDDEDYDKTAIVTVTDNGKKIYIVGNSSAKNISTLNDNKEGCLMYITGGKPSVNNTPLLTLKKLNPQFVIASTGTKLNPDFVQNVSKASAQLYATYKSGNIVLTIGANETSLNVDYNQQITAEEYKTPEDSSGDQAEG